MIHLCKMNVALLPECDVYGARWTIGPSWYENHADDELSFLPYYEPEPDQVGLDDAEIMPYAQAWAERALRETTDYLITGWLDHIIPNLDYRRHLMEIHTTDGYVHRLEISGAIARKSIRSLTDIDGAMIFTGHTSDTKDMSTTVETIIPVRNVAFVKHITEQVKIAP